MSLIKNVITTLLVGFVLPGMALEEISNGLVKVIINDQNGTFEVIDIKRNEVMVQPSEIGFTLAPYVELEDVTDNDVETNVPVSQIRSSECMNRVQKISIGESYPGAQSIAFYSTKPTVGELEVRFRLYPGKTYVDIGFSFKNLGDKAIRLRKVEVINGKFMPNGNRSYLKTLNGDSGDGKTEVLQTDSRKAENNLLCFFGTPDQQRSLVVGGLTYQDFRKFVMVSGDRMIAYAEDPVGKRVDPGTTYVSADRFYLNGSLDNPFEALEYYAETTKNTRSIHPHYYSFPSVCMWFISVTHFGADASVENSTVGSVEEMQRIKNSGFLKYSPVAVRLVPDNYEQNNQQGWWDDQHWQRYGRKERCVVDHHYKEPYETTAKWAGKIKEMGGIPITYFQPGIRSEDYAETFPGHMLYNKTRKYILKEGKIVGDPHQIIGTRGYPDLLNPGQRLAGYGKLWAESYDYTDPEFLKHWIKVNENLKEGGVMGVFYDYPEYVYPIRGGLEDRYSTAIAAYCNVFRVAREHIGKEAYLQERMGIGSDATLEYVSSVRSENDNNVMTQAGLTKAAVRWYKNRRLINYDLDGKALVETGYGNNRYKIGSVQRKAILTLSYVVSGRLLLTESFGKFSPEVIKDLSRVFPFHATTASARPLDAFVKENPSVFDFDISPSWHQLVLYNSEEGNKDFEVPLSGNTANGAMGLAANESYYFYDYWNDRFIGKLGGSNSISQTVNPGEARMISIHAVEQNPQWISTNRHIMQGYVDLVKKPEWESASNTLSGGSSVVGGDPYKITLALNGYLPERISANEGVNAKIIVRKDDPNLADIVLEAKDNQEVSWKVTFKKEDKVDQ